MPTLEAAFAEFDTDGSGKLSKEEFKKVLMRNTGTSSSSFDETMADEIMTMFDKDGDGELDIAEFIAAMEVVGPDVMANARANLELSEGIEARHAEFMKVNAEMDKLIGAGKLLAETAEDQLLKIGVAWEASSKKRCEWWAKSAEIKEMLYAGKALNKATFDEQQKIVVPESTDIYTVGPNGLVMNVSVKEQWDKFCAEVEATAPAFKEAMAKVDFIASPEYKALKDEADAIYVDVKRLDDEVRAAVEGLPDGAELNALLDALGPVPERV